MSLDASKSIPSKQVKLPRATHVGELTIGDSTISCAVLDDGRRAINETSMYSVLGRSRCGRRSVIFTGGIELGGEIPRFLAVKNLIPFIPNTLMSGSIFSFSMPSGQECYGYEASLIADVCKVFIDARHSLLPSQIPTLIRAEILLHSLAKTGIIALVDEATGYQYEREASDLQNILDRFIAKELREWTKRFPNIFFDHYNRWYGIKNRSRTPSHCGHFINKMIYKELAPGVLDELKKKNPVIEETGRRAFSHHQILTPDVGDPALQNQLVKVVHLMSVSDSREDFINLYDKHKLLSGLTN